ncbi:MAG TPA: zinc ABC transporter substrate-binding protein [Acidimicrobiia bacterium]|jgi:zinc transport system substrate-binding protein
MVLRIRRAFLTVVAGALAFVVAAVPAGAASRTSVVASFYPIAWAAQQVGGNRVSVTNLTPAGAEPHDLELTPDQIDEVLDAKVVFDLGHGFQPAVEQAAEQRDGPIVQLLPSGTKDPHVWLDPVRMAAIVRTVRRELTKADPKGRAVYARNAERLLGEFAALNTRYRDGLAHCKREVIVTAHEAFGHLAKRYGLRQEGVAGLSPDAEPDAQRIGQLTDLVKRLGITTVFTEELVSPRIATTLAREAGVRTETLNPLEGLSDQELHRGDDYVSVMDANLTKLQAALGCS